MENTPEVPEDIKPFEGIPQVNQIFENARKINEERRAQEQRGAVPTSSEQQAATKARAEEVRRQLEDAEQARAANQAFTTQHMQKTPTFDPREQAHAQEGPKGLKKLWKDLLHFLRIGR